MPQLLEYVHANEFFPSKRVTTVWGMVQPYGTRLRSYLQGIGRHELEVDFRLTFFALYIVVVFNFNFTII